MIDIIFVFLVGLTIIGVGIYWAREILIFRMNKNSIKLKGYVAGERESYGFKMQRIYVPIVEIEYSGVKMELDGLNSAHHELGDIVDVYYNFEDYPDKVYISYGFKDFLPILVCFLIGISIMCCGFYMLTIHLR